MFRPLTSLMMTIFSDYLKFDMIVAFSFYLNAEHYFLDRDGERKCSVLDVCYRCTSFISWK